jgi:hypothetical protein
MEVSVNQVHDHRSDHQEEEAETDSSDNGLDSGNLRTKDVPNTQPASRVQEGTECIHEKKTRRVNPGHPGQRRRETAHAGDELRKEHAEQPPIGKILAGAGHARFQLQREAAKETDDLIATATAEREPDRIREQASQDGGENPKWQIELSGSR